MKHFRQPVITPQKPTPRALLREPLCPLWLRLFMHVQPKQNPFSKSDFYPDQRSARPLVEGTVARGQLHEDSYFYTGKIGANPGDVMPFPVTKEVLERGRERFDIYCAP